MNSRPRRALLDSALTLRDFARHRDHDTFTHVIPYRRLYAGMTDDDVRRRLAGLDDTQDEEGVS